MYPNLRGGARTISTRTLRQIQAEREELRRALQEASQQLRVLRAERDALRADLVARPNAVDHTRHQEEMATMRRALTRAHEQHAEAEQARAVLERERDALRRERDVMRAKLEARTKEAHVATEPSPTREERPIDPGETERLREQTQRLAADLANVQRRRHEELERARRSERVDLARRLGTVRDSVTRALESIDDPGSAWSKGLEGILAQVDASLRETGARLVGEVGEPFDPSHHEAVGVAPGEAPDRIVHVARQGILVDDAVARTAQVIVSR